jgi:hypothetical protein
MQDVARDVIEVHMEQGGCHGDSCKSLAIIVELEPCVFVLVGATASPSL